MADNNFTMSNTTESAPILSQVPVSPHVTVERNVWIRKGAWFTLGGLLIVVAAVVAKSFVDAALAVCTPFVIGIATALLLDGTVVRLKSKGLSRGAAVAIVFGLSLLIFAGALAIVIPIIAAQASSLIAHWSDYSDEIQGYVTDELQRHRTIGTYHLPTDFSDLTSKLSGQFSTLLQKFFGTLSGALLGSVTLVLQIVITIIITFYLLMDIDRLQARLLFFLPENKRATASSIASDVGGVFVGYLRGLLTVCALYGVSTTMLFLGLSFHSSQLSEYALLIGAVAGVLYAVPYLGALSIALLTFILAFVSGGIGFGIFAVVLTLILNQVFDNLITPRVVGGGVGLHPVLALFALVVGGELFGFWGLLLSVPIAASIQVVLFRIFPRLSQPTPDDMIPVSHGANRAVENAPS